MIDKRNRFFHGFCPNDGNARSSFRHFIIETVREIPDYEGGTIIETINKVEDFYFDDERVSEPFYVVYGSFKIDFKTSSMLIASFPDLYRAIDLVENLTGNYVKETEQPIYRPESQ